MQPHAKASVSICPLAVLVRPAALCPWLSLKLLQDAACAAVRLQPGPNLQQSVPAAPSFKLVRCAGVAAAPRSWSSSSSAASWTFPAGPAHRRPQATRRPAGSAPPALRRPGPPSPPRQEHEIASQRPLRQTLGARLAAQAKACHLCPGKRMYQLHVVPCTSAPYHLGRPWLHIQRPGHACASVCQDLASS